MLSASTSMIRALSLITLPKALKELLLDRRTHTGQHCHLWRERGGEEREERGGEERWGRIDGGERWGGEMGERGGEERERERGGEERERERGGERGWEGIVLIKEVCEGQ